MEAGTTIDKGTIGPTTTNVPSSVGNQGLVIGVVVLLCACAICTLLFLFGCSRSSGECCGTSNSQRRQATNRETHNRDTSTNTEQQFLYSEDTELHKVPPPNYSKAGLYPTDENYDKEHHTYIRPVDSDDVFDNRSEPPAYESRIRMSIGSNDVSFNLSEETPQQTLPIAGSGNDESPLQMRQIIAQQREHKQIIIESAISTTV